MALLWHHMNFKLKQISFGCEIPCMVHLANDRDCQTWEHKTGGQMGGHQCAAYENDCHLLDTYNMPGTEPGLQLSTYTAVSNKIIYDNPNHPPLQ